MAKFCANCGSELKENADVCLSCGKMLKKDNFENMQQYNLYTQNGNYNNKPRIPGKGMSIAGMVLGIIATAWALLSLLSISEIEYSVSYYYSISEIIGYIIGFTLFSLTPSIVGLILSICGYRKQKSGVNIAGLILNIITLAIVVIEIVYILTYI